MKDKKLLAVLPIMIESISDKCIDSIMQPNSAAGLEKHELLIIDNSKDGYGKKYADKYGLNVYRDKDGHNLGTSISWNIGAREVLERDYDYLVIMSASMLFGPELHTTWTKQMRTFWGATAIECDGHSWHLIALHKKVFETVGLFDENFYPAYFEQIDFCYRMRMVDMEKMWPRVWVNALSQGAGLHNKVVQVPAQPLLDYYESKWGGEKGRERFDHPFNRHDLDFWDRPSIEQMANDYQLKEWW